MADRTETRQTLPLAAGHRGRGNKTRGAVARWIAAMRAVLAELTSAYHPERHYMRGGRTGGAA